MIRKAMPLLVLALVAGCSSRDADLKRFIAQTKQEQPGGVEPLPEIRAHEDFTYAAQHLRSPFVPGGSGGNSLSVRPNSSRNREHLEQFTLDSLVMKGTLNISGRTYALIQSRDGMVHNHVHTHCEMTGAIHDLPEDLGKMLLESVPRKFLKRIEDQMGFSVRHVQIDLIGTYG
jgi:Tfp pilus assembly protein PilP